jgi:hypothetical protein
MVTEKVAKVAGMYKCETCDYNSCSKFNFDKHLSTLKHQKLLQGNNITTKGNTEVAKVANEGLNFSCMNCNKIYLSRKGLWNHKKKCFVTKTPEQSEMICKLIQQNMELITQNKEFKDLIIELATKTNTNNNSNNNCNNNTTNSNNKFNMNFFLNETCKDAMNIMDFVTSLPLTLQDLEETGKQGYIKGLSRILVNGLKDIDISKRPIHCSDLKRETLYVKDNNVWEKEDAEKKRIKNAIKYISLKNARQITPWTQLKENQGYKDSYHKKSDVYLKLVYEANGGDDEELNKIIRNICSNVVIEKNDTPV